jgi:hypothetical protein
MIVMAAGLDLADFVLLDGDHPGPVDDYIVSERSHPPSST